MEQKDVQKHLQTDVQKTHARTHEKKFAVSNCDSTDQTVIKLRHLATS